MTRSTLPTDPIEALETLRRAPLEVAPSDERVAERLRRAHAAGRSARGGWRARAPWCAGGALLLASAAAGALADRIWITTRVAGAPGARQEVVLDAGGAGTFTVPVPEDAAGAPDRFDFDLEGTDAAWVSFDIETVDGEARIHVREHAHLAIEPAAAARVFAELEALSGREGGALWGLELEGPLLLVDPATRFAIANRPDPDGNAVERDGVYLHQLPRTMGIANTAVEWRGQRWTMVLWPLPADPGDRARLLAHEAFHRLQPELGLWRSSGPCGHLDERDGRLWLRMEARAMACALEAADAAVRRRAVQDALVFRAFRQRAFEGAREAEDALEIVEGTAEYTGLVASAVDAAAARAAAARALANLEERDPLARSFAYATGPALGLALDELAPGWRARVAEHPLAELLATSLEWEAPADLAAAAEARGEAFDLALVRAEEDARELKRRARQAELRARFLEGPVLVLSPERPELSFDPNRVEALGDAGHVYGTLWLSDAWGVLDATGGALVGPTMEVRLPAPTDLEGETLAGSGWTLTLAPGWTVRAGARVGEQRLARER